MAAYASAWLDKLAIAELAQLERACRDKAEWAAMRATYYDDSWVSVSWFDGTGPDFVAGSRKMYESGGRSIHEVGVTLVELAGDRAIADTGCAIHVRKVIGGAECDVVSYCRHRSRVERGDDGWRLRSFYATYQRDELAPVIPGSVVKLDEKLLSSFRPSYRYLCYSIVEDGGTPNVELPGFDRPEQVSARYQEDAEWLHR